MLRHCKSALTMAGALSVILLAGCTDDSLDLGDIDTTMKLEINDLTLPLNLSPILFDDMVDLDDTEGVEVINGEYVLIKSGSFHSEEIHIRDIQTTATYHFDQPALPIKAETGSHFDIPEVSIPFSYEYDDVDKYIKKIKSGNVNLTLSYVMTVKSGNKPIDCQFADMVFDLPKGFYGEVTVNDEPIKDFDASKSNIVNAGTAKVDADGNYKFEFHITSFEFGEIEGATLDGQNFSLHTDFGVKSGRIEIIEGNGEMGEMTSDFDISKMEVKSFSGTVYYDVKELNPEQITLDDLPDVLTDKETKLRLKNPQLYVSLQNPLAKYGATASTGLKITQVREDAPEKDLITSEIIDSITLEPIRLEITDSKALQEFCLSPTKPGKYYDNFPNPTHYMMKNLGEIIYGEGLPQGLNIDFERPEMGPSEVHDFELAQDLGTVSGDYTFYAPLDLGKGSHIFYTEEATDWGLSTDDNQLDIRKLAIYADCVSDLPVNVTITAKPLDSNGKEIKGVKVEEVTINPFGTNPIKIVMEGNIKDLDGMRYTITIDADQDTSALKPTMSLKLTNLKVVVSGSYIVDANDSDDE